jgi:hypothetical protein
MQIVSFPRPRWSGRAAALLMLVLAAGCDDDPTDARKPVAAVEGITAQSQVIVSAWDEYRLESVDGKPLPVTMLEGSFQDESGATHAYRWELTEGLLRMLPRSRYERRFTFRIHAGGSPPRTETLVEHGTLFYHMPTGELIFDSDDQDVPDGHGTLSLEGILSMKQRGSESEPMMTYLFRRR